MGTDPEDNTDDADTFVVGLPDLKITKTAAPTNARPGDVVTYTPEGRERR